MATFDEDIIAVIKIYYENNEQFVNFNKWLKSKYYNHTWRYTFKSSRTNSFNKMKIDEVYDDFKEFHSEDRPAIVILYNDDRIHYFDNDELEIIKEHKIIDWNKNIQRQLKLNKLLNI